MARYICAPGCDYPVTAHHARSHGEVICKLIDETVPSAAAAAVAAARLAENKKPTEALESVITMRVTLTERALLEKVAARLDETLSSFIRRSAREVAEMVLKLDS